uniref:Sodium channel protein n=1 Tax=Monodelphis domestica TaxID=13616 RepID=A0A5F8H6I7_MONDO
MASPNNLTYFTRKSLTKEYRADRKKDEEEEELEPSSDLEAGEQLAFIYGDVPSEMVSEPLEDLDPYYKDKKTFLVLNEGRIIFRFSATSALYILTPFNLIRRLCIKVLVNLYPFAKIHWQGCLSVIIDMSFFHLMYLWILAFSLPFLGLYTFEILIKILARGFCIGPFTFLSDPWNWFDIPILTMALFVNLGSFPYLGIFSVLRIMKAVSLNIGKSVVRTLTQSMKMFQQTVMLIVFCLSVFAVMGMQLFMGKLKQKCVINKLFHSYSFQIDYFYYLEGQKDALLCGNSSYSGDCPEGYMCVKAGMNPDHNYTSFDHFGWSLLTLFRLMTLDCWENLYQQILRAAGKTYVIFFIVVLLFCSFYLVTLILAMVILAYEKQNQITIKAAKRRQIKYQAMSYWHKRKVKQGRTARKEQEERQIDFCCISKDILDDPTIRSTCTNWWHRFGTTFTIWNCSTLWIKFKDFIYAVVMDPFFDLAIAICIIINITFMAMEHYPMTEKFYNVLSVGYLVFIGIYIAEMFLKIIALHPYNYFQRGWNIFDTVIVILALADIYMKEAYGLSLFGWFRLLLVFKVAKYWPTWEKLIKIINYSVDALKGLFLLLFITMFTFAVVGMKLFGQGCQEYLCKTDVDCPFKRWHMHDFFHSFLLMFRVLCGEWIDSMWDCMNTEGQKECLIFFVVVIIIGKMQLLVLFVALLSSFSPENFAAIQVSPESNNLQLAMARIQKGIYYVKRTLFDLVAKGFSKKQMISNDIQGEENLNLEKRNHTINGMSKKIWESQDRLHSNGCRLEKYVRDKSHFPSLVPNSNYSTLAPIALGESDFENVIKEARNELDIGSSKEVTNITGFYIYNFLLLSFNIGKQCGCIRRFPYCKASKKSRKGKIWWNLRKTCYRTVNHGCFEISIVFIVLLSCFALIFEDIYIEKRKTIKIILEYGNMIFTYIFILEMLLKWMAYGYKTYFSNVWCWLEFLVVNVCIIHLLQMLSTNNHLLKTFYTPEIMMVVLHIFLKAIPSILEALLVWLICWLLFSLMGVNLFAGKFFKCINITTGERLPWTLIIDVIDCKMLSNSSGDVQWKNPKANFDNIGNGYFSLLQLLLHEITIFNKQPKNESNVYIYLYFVIFVILGLCFPFVFFVRVVINHLKQQIIFVTLMIIPLLQNKFQGYIFDLITKEAFEITIIVLICLNTVVMMVETDTQDTYKRNILYQINLVFIGLFAGECLLKLIGLRLYYFTIGWNIFDFVVIHLSIMVVLLPHLTVKYLLTYSQVQVIRLIRCGRVLNFIKGTKVLGPLIYALMLSLPTLLNIVLLLLLIMFIYAILGMSHFAYIKKDAGINDMFNFETFGNSMLCLFQITTFAGWNGLLEPVLSTGPPDCDPEKIHPGSSVKGDCGSPSFGVFYFVSYIIISFLVLVNLFIVVILEICNVVTEENAQLLSEEVFDNFYEVWKQFDPDGTHFIDYSQLSEFAASLDPPFLIAKPNKIQLTAMDLPMVKGDRVFCADVLIAFTKCVMRESEEFNHICLPLRKHFLSSCLFQVSYEPVTTTLKRKQEEVSALVIQRAFRRFCLRQNESGIYNIKGEAREKLTIEEAIVIDKIPENSTLEKVSFLSPPSNSLYLDSVIEIVSQI